MSLDVMLQTLISLNMKLGQILMQQSKNPPFPGTLIGLRYWLNENIPQEGEDLDYHKYSITLG